MPDKRRVEHLSDWGISYVDNGDGTAETVHGDATKDPKYMGAQGYIGPDEKRGPRLKTPKGGEGRMKEGRDLLVNTASQLPLAIPGLGLPARAALSVATGMGTDQLAYPEHSMEDSTSEAVLNSLIGGVSEGLAGGTLKLKAPSAPSIGVGGSGLMRNMWLNLKGLSPISRNPMAKPPGLDMLDLLGQVPSVQDQVKSKMAQQGGKFLTQQAIEAIKQAKSQKEKDIIISSFKKLGLKNLLPGIGANEGIDLTVNRKEE